jgi:NAD(P)-dependent dehydrogenase (short-subunit alcohol dehydrogenase family)
MTTELYWMTLTVLITALFWVPYTLDRLAVRGTWTALSDTGPETGQPHSLWAQRAIKAHANGLAQALARELGPRGVHVAHVVIDGLIDEPQMTGRFGPASAVRMEPDTIAAAYLPSRVSIDPPGRTRSICARSARSSKKEYST